MSFKAFLVVSIITISGSAFAKVALQEQKLIIKPVSVEQAKTYPLCNAKAQNRPCYYKPKPGSKDTAGVIE